MTIYLFSAVYLFYSRIIFKKLDDSARILFRKVEKTFKFLVISDRIFCITFELFPLYGLSNHNSGVKFAYLIFTRHFSCPNKTIEKQPGGKQIHLIILTYYPTLFWFDKLWYLIAIFPFRLLSPLN